MLSNPNNAETMYLFSDYEGDSIAGNTDHYLCLTGYELTGSDTRVMKTG